MNDNVTGWTCIVIFQMIDQTRFTNCKNKEIMNIFNANQSDHCHNDHDIWTKLILTGMKTLCDRGGINKVSITYFTCDVRIETFQLDLPLHCLVQIGNHLRTMVFPDLIATVSFGTVT